MLSEEDKQRIREEEIFRAEVQKSLSQPAPSKSFSGRLWAFLNTSLGIWVLSTIALGAVGWTYTQWQLSRQNVEQINKIDIEIEARLEAAERDLANRGLRENEKPFYIANLLLLPPMGERMVQPEFANRNLRSLMYELMNRLPISEQGEVLIALTHVQWLETQYIDKQLTPEETLELQRKFFVIHDTRWRWDKMMSRQSAAYNYPYTLMTRVGLFLFTLLLLFLLSLLSNSLWRRWKLRRSRSLEKPQEQQQENLEQDVNVQADNP